MGKILAFFVLYMTLCACNNGKSKIVEFEIDYDRNAKEFDIYKENNKKYTLKSEDIFGEFTDILVVDTLLFCGTLHDDKLIDVYSLNNKKLLSGIINRGTYINEGLSASSISIDKSESSPYLSVYDITLGKLFKIGISEKKTDSLILSPKEILLDGILKNIVEPQIGNNFIISTTYSLDDCRYIYSDGNKIIKKVGKLPNVLNDDKLTDIANSKIPNKAYIFKAFAIKKPNDTKVGVFYNKTDRVEFYDNDKLYKICYSKNRFNPIMQVDKLDNGYMIQDFENTKYAYLSVTYDEKNIYALCSTFGDYKTSSNKILVFNWSGDIVYKISLDRKVCKIFIEPINKVLYCYDDVSQNVFSTKL